MGIDKDMDSTIQIIGTIDIGSEIIGDGMIETEEINTYINGRRGSNGVIVTPNGSSRGNGNSIITNPNVRINVGRGNGIVRNYDVKPNPNDIDVVIEKPNRNFIGRLFDKIEDTGVRVRTYNNPNNVPNNIRNNNNNWNNRVVPRNNNNFNIPRSSNPVRSYSPPPPSSNPPVINRGSSSEDVISRGSRGNNIN